MDEASDQARFAEVFLPHLVDAFRLARWLAGARADAEDIVQEAAMRGFRAIRSFSGGNPRSWVLTIVRNTSYSWLAKNRPKAVVLAGDVDDQTQKRLEDEASEMQTPELALIAKMEADAVKKAVAELPAPFREVLVLREIHDLDYRAIAEVAQIPIGTVMSRLARARRMVLATLQEDAA